MYDNATLHTRPWAPFGPHPVLYETQTCGPFRRNAYISGNARSAMIAAATLIAEPWTASHHHLMHGQ